MMTNSKIEIEIVPSLDNELVLSETHVTSPDFYSEVIDGQLKTFKPQSIENCISHSDTSLDIDSSLDKQLKLKSDEVRTPSHQMSPMPAHLCDDVLLNEIQAIPNKMAFKIGDVADILGIKQYVLRYWETEFDILRPKKASNNQRMYTRKDVENALLIRKLLHRDRFSIEGAKNAMKDLKIQIKKEKSISQVMTQIESINAGIETLLLDIRRLKAFF